MRGCKFLLKYQRLMNDISMFVLFNQVTYQSALKIMTRIALFLARGLACRGMYCIDRTASVAVRSVGSVGSAEGADSGQCSGFASSFVERRLVDACESCPTVRLQSHVRRLLKDLSSMTGADADDGHVERIRCSIHRLLRTLSSECFWKLPSSTAQNYLLQCQWLESEVAMYCTRNTPNKILLVSVLADVHQLLNLASNTLHA